MNWKTSLKIGIFGICLIVSCMVSAQKKNVGNFLVSEEEKNPVEEIKRVASCGFSKPIRVATTVNNRPFGWSEWLNSRYGDALIGKGFGIEMFEEIAQSLKIRYQIVAYESDKDAIMALKRGDLDLLIGVYTPDITVGDNSLTVYPAIFTNVFSVYYRKDKAFDVLGYRSLSNKKGMVRRTENIYPLFSSHMPSDSHLSVVTTEEAFRKLMSGEADYLIGSPYSIEAELRRYKLHNDIISSPKAISYATLFMVLTKGTNCYKLKDVLGNAIENYTADSKRVDEKIRKVIDEWGERFRNTDGFKLEDHQETSEKEEDKNSSEEEK